MTRITPVLAVAFACLSGLTAHAGIIDTMKHDIGQVSDKSWGGKVQKFRNSSVFSILFYKPDVPGIRKIIDGPYNELAKNMKGIVEVFAIDCSESPKTCSDNGVSKFPSVKLFPTLPLPPFDYQGKLEYDDLAKALRPLIPSQVKAVADNKELEAQLLSTVQIPKVLIFTDKPAKQPPVLVKALSNAFKEKLIFFYLSAKEFPDATKKFKVNSFPHLVVVRKDKKDEVYRGEFKFDKLFDWLNVFSETFVLGGGFTDAVAPETVAEVPAWRLESIPEVTKMSHMDLCFKKSARHLCVMWVKEGRELTGSELETMESIKADYEGLDGKGPDYRFMWMDLKTETEFAELLEFTKLPSIVVFNPHKKTRFVKLDADLVPIKPNIRKLLEKISSGDARFKVVPQAKMPKFVGRNGEKNSATPSKEEL